MDEEVPEVVGMVPEPGSTNIDRGQPIIFRFSESMDHRSTEHALFFTPDIGSTLRIEWRGRELRLIPRQPYRENTTIVITLGADATDMRRNRLGQSVTLAFSTGPILDNSSVSGAVLEEGRFAAGAWIWIYSLGDEPGQEVGADPSLVSAPEPVYPLFITQADDAGRFEQTHMARGIYRVFAFRDVDGNRRYDLDTDPLAVPPTDIRFVVEDDRSTGLILNLAMRDTTGPSIRSASAPNNNYLHVRFNEPPAPAGLPQISVESYEPTGEAPAQARITGGYIPLQAPTTLVARVEGLEPGSRYRVRLLEARDGLGNPGRAASRPITFTVPAQADTAQPRIMAITPSDSSRSLNRDTRLRLTFSTEIDTSGLPPWMLVGPDTIGLERDWLDPLTVELIPLDPVVPDAFYRLTIAARSLQSWTGLNGPAEEHHMAWRGIRPAGRGTLRFQIEGVPLPSHGRYRVIIEGVSGGTAPRTELELSAPGELITPELPVGPYWIWGFADVDGDGALDVGRLRPFRPAEAVGAISDTLYVINTFESVYEVPLILGAYRRNAPAAACADIRLAALAFEECPQRSAAATSPGIPLIRLAIRHQRCPRYRRFLR